MSIENLKTFGKLLASLAPPFLTHHGWSGGLLTDGHRPICLLNPSEYEPVSILIFVYSGAISINQTCGP